MFGRSKKPFLAVGALLDHMGPGHNAAEIAAVLYTDEKTVRRWIRRPRTKLDPYYADTLAMRIGKHPFQIWQWDWIDAE